MSSSGAVLASLFVLSLAALLLSGLVLRRWKGPGSRAYLYWGVGLLLVFVTTLQEALIYAGAWSQLLLQSYFILVAVLVGILSLGSAELALSGRFRPAWFAYIGAASVAMVVVGLLYPVGSAESLLVDGVVTGNPPAATLVVSSLLTIPGALMLAGASLYGVVKDRRWNLLYIVAGVIVISIAGGLYAFLAFPITLYYTEFVGFVLLFLGFVRVPGLSAPMQGSHRPHAPPI